VVNFDQTGIGASGTVGPDRSYRREFMTSIVQFISGPVFEPAELKLMSDAYDRAIEVVCSFGCPNATVEGIMATRIINLTKGGERDPERLRDKALAACGFNEDRARKAVDQDRI
jgi:hypothetical protein